MKTLMTPFLLTGKFTEQGVFTKWTLKEIAENWEFYFILCLAVV